MSSKIVLVVGRKYKNLMSVFNNLFVNAVLSEWMTVLLIGV